MKVQTGAVSIPGVCRPAMKPWEAREHMAGLEPQWNVVIVRPILV